jgi:hypothetical protein
LPEVRRRYALVLLVGLLLAGAASGQSGLRLMNKGREGQLFTVTDYLVKGKTNVVEFSSVACPACKALEPKLAALGQKKSDLVVNQVAVDRAGSQGIDWQSPLARQYELRNVPYFKVYDQDGKLLAEGEPARKMISKLLIEAGVI